MIPPLFGKQEVGIWRVKKRFPRYGVPIWSLWPNIRSVPSIVAEKNVHICPMYKNQLSQQAGSRNLTGPKTLPTIWHTYLKLVTKYQISAINSCCEKCDEKHRGLTEGQTEGRTEVKQYTPLRWSGGIKIQHKCKMYERNIPGNIQRIKFQSSCKHMQPSCPATRTGN